MSRRQIVPRLAELFIVMPFGHIGLYGAGVNLILKSIDIGSIRIELIPQDPIEILLGGGLGDLRDYLDI